MDKDSVVYEIIQFVIMVAVALFVLVSIRTSGIGQTRWELLFALLASGVYFALLVYMDLEPRPWSSRGR